MAVLDLTHIDLATAEDEKFGIVHWANLFKARTWEEIKMIAQNSDYIKEASETIYKLTEDERVRMQCEAREDFYRRQRTQQRWVENLQQRLARAEEELENKVVELENKVAELESKDAEIARLRMLLEQGE